MARGSGTFTFLFSDLEGSTRLWETAADAMAEATEAHERLLRRAVEDEGGHLFKLTGDGACAAFATTIAAVRAAVRIQQAAAAQRVAGRALAPRIGLHAGVAEVRDGDYFGRTVNRAARLMSIGHGGQILLSQPAFELVRDLLPAELRLRDLGEHREAARATACCRYLFVCSLQDERDGLKYAAEGLALAQKLGASELAVETVAMQGMLAMGLGDAAEAERFANEALSLAQTSGSDTSMPLILLGEIARIEGKLEKARDYNLASLELFERHGRAKSASNRLNLGAIELELGNLDAAAGWLSETLEIVYPKQHYPHVASALVAIAVLALKRNQPTRAATLWGAAGRMRDDRRTPVQVGDRPFEAWVERQLQALPAAEQAAAQTGRSMNLEAVVEMAREICAGARGLASAGAPAARGERPSGE